jgi:hypothetical protein
MMGKAVVATGQVLSVGQDQGRTGGTSRLRRWLAIAACGALVGGMGSFASGATANALEEPPCASEALALLDAQAELSTAQVLWSLEQSLLRLTRGAPPRAFFSALERFVDAQISLNDAVGALADCRASASDDEVPEDEVPEDEVPEDEVPEDEVPEDEVPEDEDPVCVTDCEPTLN